MQIKINGDISSYKENLFFGLDLKQLIWSAAGAVACVFIYFSLRETVSTEIISWICVFAALPFAFFGFFRYNGMGAFRFLKTYLVFRLLTKKKLGMEMNTLYGGGYRDR